MPRLSETNNITPETKKESTISLLLISFLSLFLELVFIRWLPANVLSLAYFSNIVLISSFLGLGIGILASPYKKDLFRFFPYALVLVLWILSSFRQYEVIVPPAESEWIWSYYGANMIDAGRKGFGIFTALTIVYLLNTALFVMIGQKIGRLMNYFKSNRAYMINLAGSLFGVMAFGLLSFSEGIFNSPLFWFTLCSALALWFYRKEREQFVYASIAAVAVFTVLWTGSAKDTVWSPYYSIQKKTADGGSLMVYVNRFFHQKAVNFSEDAAALEKYSLPYRIKNPKSVLILGAGTGNDAAVALLNGAQEIDAVEIDSVILRLGKDHPNKPFYSPHVRTIVDDARSYIKKTEKKYDMVILGTLDSHALLSGMSTVRLDNYVYTLESMKDVNGLLNDDGVAVLMFSAPNTRLADKLLQLAFRSFDHPVAAFFPDNYLFNLMIIGGSGASGIIEEGKGLNIELHPVTVNAAIKDIPTDDWPYLYLARKTIPSHYLKAIGLLLLLSFIAVAAVSRLKTGIGKSGITFFALGSAFLLLETKSVTTLSLLFGSTWLVNVFVFSGILVVALAANYVLLKREIRSVQLLYLLLGICLAVTYFIHPQSFLESGFWVRSVLSALIVALPLFFSSLIFAFHIKTKSQLGPVFGINLLGAVFGGFLEYSSMIAGLNNLYIIAGALYLVAYLSFKLHPGKKPTLSITSYD